MTERISRKQLANKVIQTCDIMRRDDGTTGILEYMEQLSWMIFLKIFEDLEKRLKQEAEFDGRKFGTVIDRQFQWSNWAKRDWKKKEDLIKFIDTELFPYLKELKGSKEKDQISSIFEEISGNRMKSVYNLMDVIDLLDEIDFNQIEDAHVLSQVYEELLLWLGREGGVAGEFYTPRPIIRLMVKMVDPKIGDSILDPFCGSGGFLIESYKYMKERVKTLTTHQYEILQNSSFYGQEKKPLPYLMGVMNCILNEILSPNIIRTNTLERNIRNISKKDRYDIILTNPPFGGKEGKQIQQNFPIQSQSTELLAMQFVMKHLLDKGKCGIVVPEGILFRGNAYYRVKRDLFESFNLHTIISLPSGVFANVSPSGTGPKTNLLFFEKGKKTKSIWYYDFNNFSSLELGKNYTKSSPVSDEDLEDCLKKWQQKEDSKYSWKVSIDEITIDDYDLTAKNPNLLFNDEIKDPDTLLKQITNKEKEVIFILRELEKLLDN